MWLPAYPHHQRTSIVETSTSHAPLLHVDDHEQDQWRLAEPWEEHGLLCLERTIPEEILRGLENLSYSSEPFKLEAVRGDELAWAESLTSALTSLSEHKRGAADRHHADNKALPESLRDSEPSLGSTGNPQSAGGASCGGRDALEAARWLAGDVKRVAGLFAKEASRLSPDASGEPSPRGPDTGVDVTVKLELLERGKCPRLHLDKVSRRTREPPCFVDRCSHRPTHFESVACASTANSEEFDPSGTPKDVSS